MITNARSLWSAENYRSLKERRENKHLIFSFLGRKRHFPLNPPLQVKQIRILAYSISFFGKNKLCRCMPREIVVCMYLRTEEGIELDMSLHHPIYSTCMHSSFFPRGEITANQAPSPSSLRPFGIRFFAVQRKWVLAREGERDSAALRYICRRGHFSPPEGRRTDHHAQSRRKTSTPYLRHAVGCGRGISKHKHSGKAGFCSCGWG